MSYQERNLWLVGRCPRQVLAFDVFDGNSCEERSKQRRREVEAANPFRVEVAKETKRSNVSDANGGLRDWRGFFGQPTHEEVSHLNFGKLGDIRIHAQELRNQFAHLLNRGSSLE